MINLTGKIRPESNQGMLREKIKRARALVRKYFAPRPRAGPLSGAGPKPHQRVSFSLTTP